MGARISKDAPTITAVTAAAGGGAAGGWVVPDDQGDAQQDKAVWCCCVKVPASICQCNTSCSMDN